MKADHFRGGREGESKSTWFLGLRSPRTVKNGVLPSRTPWSWRDEVKLKADGWSPHRLVL